MDREMNERSKGSHLPERMLPERGMAGITSRGLLSLSGRDALNAILRHDHPLGLVRALSRTDFYWLVKKIGEDDCVPLLELASQEQWEHLLDMEVWERDHLIADRVTQWLERFLQADPPRLVRWLGLEKEHLCYLYMFRSIEVDVRRGDDALDIPEDAFTVDNIYYVRVLDKEHEEMIIDLLRRMAAQDYVKYQALLLGLGGIMPAELEEELYRRRNMSLAEDGFLPFEEAMALYTHLKADALRRGSSPYLPDGKAAGEEEISPPLLPLLHVDRGELLIEAMRRIADPLLLDRLRLEFAGLCNQMLSADHIQVTDVDVLIKTCRRVASYVGIGLETLSGGEGLSAEKILAEHPLISVFRVGFGFGLELKWEAERWMERAWWSRKGLGFSFWGEEWGGMLEGLLQQRPMYYGGGEGEDAFRPFENLLELERSRTALQEIFAVDRLLEHLTSPSSVSEKLPQEPLITFDNLLFTYWARLKVDLDPGFEPVSLEEARDLFRLLRKGKARSPFHMKGYKKVFVGDFLAVRGDFRPKERRLLTVALNRLWDEFSEEYAQVALADIAARFSRFILIRPGLRGTPG